MGTRTPATTALMCGIIAASMVTPRESPGMDWSGLCTLCEPMGRQALGGRMKP